MELIFILLPIFLVIGFAGGYLYSKRPRQTGTDGGETEVARLLKAGDGSLRILLDGKTYRRKNEINEARLQDLMLDAGKLLAWLGITSQSADAPPEPIEPPAPLTAVTAPPKAGTAAAKVVEEPKSIVGQIDEILQRRIAETPLAEKNIRLVESPRGVIVMIGLDKFEGPEKIPDLDVRTAIRGAVEEYNQLKGR
jgi:hypothetical protein